MAVSLSQRTVAGTVANVYPVRYVGEDETAVVNFSVGVTHSTFNRKTKEWEDGETEWINAVAWRRLAENIAKSFNVGDRVILVGDTRMKDGYENDEGEEVPPRPELVVRHAALDIVFDPAHSEREAKKKTRAQEEEDGDKPSRGSKKSKPSSSSRPKKSAKKEDDGFDFDDDEDFSF